LLDGYDLVWCKAHEAVQDKFTVMILGCNTPNRKNQRLLRSLNNDRLMNSCSDNSNQSKTKHDTILVRHF